MIKEIWGRGLIRGIVFKDESKLGEFVKFVRERGVLFLIVGKDVVRFVFVLVVSKEECDKVMGVIESCLYIIEGDKV